MFFAYSIEALIAAIYDPENCIRCVEGILDPCGVAAAFHIDKLEEVWRAHGGRPSPIGLVLFMLRDPAFALQFKKTSSPSCFRPSFRDHVKFASQLQKEGLARPMKRSDKVKGYSRFFTVVKKVNEDGETILRSINDCYFLNQVTPDSLPVNLPTLLEVQDALRDVECIRTLDLRHWFHCIPIGPHLSQFLGIALGPVRLIWLVLPMGWKLAPLCAQAITWFLVAGNESFHWTELPRVYRKGRVRVVVWYDNVIMGGPRAETDIMWKELKDRCLIFGAPIKEEFSAFRPGDFIDAIGLRWTLTANGVEWELLPKMRKKLVDSASRLLAEKVLRIKEVAKIVGTLVWSRWAYRRHLYDLQPAYAALSKEVREHGWRGAMKTDDVKYLAALAQELAEDTRRIGLHRASRTAVWCSDASVTGFGGIDLVNHEYVAGLWRHTHESKDIFYLEALALKLVVSKASEGCDITVGVDNQGLLHAIRKRSTRCPRTARVLAEMFMEMDACGKTLRVVYIHTDDNPADEPSRQKRINWSKVEAARVAMTP